MDMELRHLRAFTAVAHARSFTDAATEVGITQPALSRTIQQLERIVGIPLLDRSSRAVRLTDAGTVFLQHATRVLDEAEQALRALASPAQIRLGFSWLLPDPWMQVTAHRFQHESAGSITLHRCDDVLADLRAGLIDAGIIRGATPKTLTGPRRLLFHEKRLAVCSTRSPLAEAQEISWQDIPLYPLVVNTISGTTSPTSWPASQRPKRIIDTNNFDEWLESVAANHGIGVVPATAARRITHPAVHFLPVPDAPPVAVHLVARLDTPLMRAFFRSAAPV